MKTHESLVSTLKTMAEDIVDDRVEQWARYYFEKELLPSLKAEIKERCVVQLLTSFERHNAIELKVEFTPIACAEKDKK